MPAEQWTLLLESVILIAEGAVAKESLSMYSVGNLGGIDSNPGRDEKQNTDCCVI